MSSLATILVITLAQETVDAIALLDIFKNNSDDMSPQLTANLSLPTYVSAKLKKALYSETRHVLPQRASISIN